MRVVVIGLLPELAFEPYPIQLVSTPMVAAWATLIDVENKIELTITKLKIIVINNMRFDFIYYLLPLD
jgi:hypothetical protein